jgi:hypothetical protein
MKIQKKDREETNLKVWIWTAVIDISAIVLVGSVIFLGYSQHNLIAVSPE